MDKPGRKCPSPPADELHGGKRGAPLQHKFPFSAAGDTGVLPGMEQSTATPALATNWQQSPQHGHWHESAMRVASHSMMCLYLKKAPKGNSASAALPLGTMGRAQRCPLHHFSKTASLPAARCLHT